VARDVVVINSFSHSAKILKILPNMIY
jgi:hypothetical protein